MTCRPVCCTRQVRDDLRRTDDGIVPEISVNVYELRDHRPAKDSRGVFGVLAISPPASESEYQCANNIDEHCIETWLFAVIQLFDLPRRLDLFIYDLCCERAKHNTSSDAQSKHAQLNGRSP